MRQTQSRVELYDAVAERSGFIQYRIEPLG